MLVGECPYCNGPIEIEELGPGETIAFERMPCPAPLCGKTYWVRHSPFVPVAYTNDAFAKEYIVDDDAKTIELRMEPEKPLPEIQQDRCPCGGIILADTEEWKTPLCDECYGAAGEPKSDPQSLSPPRHPNLS